MGDETKAGRTNLAIGDVYHTVLKMMAAARSITLTTLLEEMLYDQLKIEFEKDVGLAMIVRQLIARDQREETKGLRERTLNLLDKVAPHTKPGAQPAEEGVA